MGNRMSNAVGALKRRKRVVINTMSVGAIGALALGTLGTGVATAHGMVGSPQIKDQSINSWDIGHNQVGSSELRGPAHDSGPAVASHHVQDQSLGHWDIKDGTIGEWDLNQDVTDKLDQGQEHTAGPNFSDYEVDGFYTTEREGRPDAGPPIPGGGQAVQRTAECADEKFAIGGGSSNGNTEPGNALDVKESHPSGFKPIDGDEEGSVKATSWSVTFDNPTDEEQVAQVYVICASVN